MKEGLNYYNRKHKRRRHEWAKFKKIKWSAIGVFEIVNLVYDINTNFAPIKISNLLSKITSVHSYSRRSSTSEHFFTKQSALNVQGQAFSRVCVKIWNGIPTSLKNVSRNCFSKTVRTKLIEILETENSYADIDTLINKMKN